MSPDGTYVTHFNHNATPEELAERLQAELKKRLTARFRPLAQPPRTRYIRPC